jgi:hypothetical protein
VVKDLGLGLVVATLVEPVQHFVQSACRWPEQGDKEPAHFGDADLQEQARLFQPSAPVSLVSILNQILRSI